MQEDCYGLLLIRGDKQLLQPLPPELASRALTELGFLHRHRFEESFSQSVGLLARDCGKPSIGAETHGMRPGGGGRRPRNREGRGGAGEAKSY